MILRSSCKSFDQKRKRIKLINLMEIVVRNSHRPISIQLGEESEAFRWEECKASSHVLDRFTLAFTLTQGCVRSPYVLYMKRFATGRERSRSSCSNVENGDNSPGIRAEKLGEDK